MRRSLLLAPRQRVSVIASALTLAIAVAARPSAAQCDGYERGLGLPGVQSNYITQVLTQLPWDPDGAGAQPEVLVVAGYIEAANGVPVRWICTWDGEAFAEIGLGVNGWVNDVEVHNGDLYAAGQFTKAGDYVTPLNHVAKWSGSAWEEVGAGLDGTVHELLSTPGGLIATGDFTTSGGQSRSYVARWNGSTWQAMGDGFNRSGLAMYEFNGTVVCGGEFTKRGDGVSNLPYLASWNGTQWQPYQGGTDGVVRAITTYQNKLVIGGAFQHAGVVSALRVALWTGSAWESLDGGFDQSVSALTVFQSNLYAGGDFTTAGGDPAERLARYNGTWHAITPGATSTVQSLGVYEGGLYVGAYYGAYIGGFQGVGIARWDGGAWDTLGKGFNGVVKAYHEHNGVLYAAGKFSAAAGVSASNIARQSGESWLRLGSGLDVNGAHALGTFNNQLIAAGQFSNAGGVPASNIARWNGSAWNALGAGLTGGVGGYCLAVLGSDLIVGGSFTHAGGSVASNVARWNGSSWSAMGDGFNSSVHDVHVFDGELYAAGHFSMSGADAVRAVARWTGSDWVPVGSYLGNGSQAYALETFEGALILSGYDLRAPNGTCVAELVGGNWVELGSNPWGACYATVTTLANYNGDLIAGGAFSCGSLGKNILRWDGSGWNAMEGGTATTVLALFQSGEDLCIGGEFRTVDDGLPSAYIARWRCGNDCPADFNGDGAVNTQDVIGFLNAWADQDESADFNGDGFVNTQDVIGFLNAWAAGC